MVDFKIFVCLFVFAYLETSVTSQLNAGFLPSNEPRVLIEKVNGFTPRMELDASDFLKRAYTSSNNPHERCGYFRQLYAEKYNTYKWHVVMYSAYSIDSLKSIELQVGNDNYILFATKN